MRQPALLADDLLTLSRAAEAGLALSVAPTRVEALLDDARSRFTDRAASHHRAIDIELDVNLGSGAEVDVDPNRMRQALSNLIDNALRHGTRAPSCYEDRLQATRCSSR